MTAATPISSQPATILVLRSAVGEVMSARARPMKSASVRFPKSGTISDKKQMIAMSSYVSPDRSKNPGSIPM